MITISNREFMAHPERYFDIARDEDEVRITNGQQVFHLICEPPALEPDNDLRSAITGDELLAGIYSDLETFFAGRQ